MTTEEFDKLFRYRGNWCHVGGKEGGHRNYGWHHVIGCLYWEDSAINYSNECRYCGAQQAQEGG